MDSFTGFLIIAVLIAGAIFFPIGIFHGIWLWF